MTRRVAIVAIGLSAMSLVAVALTDAATIAPRLAGRALPVRALWLHAFAVSLLTLALGLLALLHQAGRDWYRYLWLLAAIANLLVPVLQRRHHELGLSLGFLHLALAAIAGVLAWASWPAHSGRA